MKIYRTYESVEYNVELKGRDIAGDVLPRLMFLFRDKGIVFADSLDMYYIERWGRVLRALCDLINGGYKLREIKDVIDVIEVVIAPDELLEQPEE